MRNKDLIAILEKLPPENEVVIENSIFGTLGGTPSVNIEYVVNGFDWDSGRIIIFPEMEMSTKSTEDLELMRKYMNLHSKVEWEKRQNGK